MSTKKIHILYTPPPIRPKRQIPSMISLKQVFVLSSSIICSNSDRVNTDTAHEIPYVNHSKNTKVGRYTIYTYIHIGLLVTILYDTWEMYYPENKLFG